MQSDFRAPLPSFPYELCHLYLAVSASPSDGVGFVLAVGLGQAKKKLRSYEESAGTGKKSGSKFIRVNARPFLLSDPP